MKANSANFENFRVFFRLLFLVTSSLANESRERRFGFRCSDVIRRSFSLLAEFSTEAERKKLNSMCSLRGTECGVCQLKTVKQTSKCVISHETPIFGEVCEDDIEEELMKLKCNAPRPSILHLQNTSCKLRSSHFTQNTQSREN